MTGSAWALSSTFLGSHSIGSTTNVITIFYFFKNIAHIKKAPQCGAFLLQLESLMIYIMPPIPPMPPMSGAPIGASSLGISATMA